MFNGRIRAIYLDHAPTWVSGHISWRPERKSPVRRLAYSLRNLAERELIDWDSFAMFCASTGLADFTWRIFWADEYRTPNEQSVANALRCAEGVLVFIHGWDGSGEVWEDLPAAAIQQNPGLVALVPDVNGFGGTPFASPMPSPAQCEPPALMAALEAWLEIIGLRNRAQMTGKRPHIFVGHSMGGAALFFLNTDRWASGEVGRIATAPALLLSDKQRQRFYQALGAGIRISAWSDLADQITEQVIAPIVIEALAGGASDFVRSEHQHVFRQTAQGVLAQTFAAMGLLSAELNQDEWPNFHVFLAHRDRLVGLSPTLNLLESLNFSAAQIRVALGDHYFFSIGKDAKQHSLNRDLLIADILAMQEELATTR